MFEGNITLHFQYKIICNSPNYYTKNWDQLNFDFKTIKMIQIQSRSKGRKKKKKKGTLSTFLNQSLGSNSLGKFLFEKMISFFNIDYFL